MEIGEPTENNPTNQNISVGKTPQYFAKFDKSIKMLTEQLLQQKAQTDAMLKYLKYIEKTATRLFEKEKKKFEKNAAKSTEPKRKKGFTQPVKISEVLSKFMNMPTETLVSRTDVTKYVMQYIKEKGLENPDNRRQIWPDDALWELLGESARNEAYITHFNLQKYMSVHFLKKV